MRLAKENSILLLLLDWFDNLVCCLPPKYDKLTQVIYLTFQQTSEEKKHYISSKKGMEWTLLIINKTRKSTKLWGFIFVKFNNYGALEKKWLIK